MARKFVESLETIKFMLYAYQLRTVVCNTKTTVTGLIKDV